MSKFTEFAPIRSSASLGLEPQEEEAATGPGKQATATTSTPGTSMPGTSSAPAGLAIGATAGSPTAVATTVTTLRTAATHDTSSEETAALPEGVELRFDATVPRRLVHRSSIAEVFVTDSVQTGPDTYAVAAQLPRAHMVGEDASFHDFLLLVEVARQSGVLVAHRHLDVDLDMAFVFRRLRLTMADPSSLRVGSAPAQIVVSMTVDVSRNRAGRVQGLKFTGEVAVDGRSAFVGHGELVFVSRTAFRALRGRSRGGSLPGDGVLPNFVPASPATVGRRDQRNVVLTEPTTASDGAAAGAVMIIDVTHPHIFDHPLDHAPGNLQLEAARQLAIAAVARANGLDPRSLQITAADADFSDFAELDRVTRVSATLGQFVHDERLGVLAVPATVELTQGEKVTAAVRLEVAQC